MTLVSLQFETKNNFKKNLNKLIKLIKQAPSNSFILAPELCLTGYSYDIIEEAALFTPKAIKKLLDFSENKIISLTLVDKIKGKYFNTLYILHKRKIIHKQSKVKLFSLNGESKYFASGNINKIEIVEIQNIKIACLICFEIRFIELWKQIQGADIILVPAMWGISRKDNFKTLTKALAIVNQCFVLASNSANKNMAKSSGIINPFGNTYRNDNKNILIKNIYLKEIKKMRRYLNIGLKV